jgi:hypothetical protein
LLRNGVDYLDTYGDPNRALRYLKEAKRRQKELVPAERKSLDAALARAQRMIAGTEVVKTPVVRRSSATPMSTGFDGSLFDGPTVVAKRRVSANPIKADSAILTTAAPTALEPQPLILQGLPTPTSTPSSVQEPPDLTSANTSEPPSEASEPENSEPAQPIGLTILPGPEEPASVTPNADSAATPEETPAVEPAAPLEPSDPATSDTTTGASEGVDVVSQLPSGGITPPEGDNSATDASLAAPVATLEPAPDLDVPSLPTTNQPPANEKTEAPSQSETVDPATDDTNDLPELHSSPIEGSDAIRRDESIPAIMPSRARLEDNHPRSAKLLLPPPAPRPAQRLGGIEVVNPTPRDNQPAAIETESTPAGPIESPARPLLPPDPPELPPEPPVLSGADTHARVEPEAPSLSGEVPGQGVPAPRPDLTQDAAAIPAAPAPRAEELLEQRNAGAAASAESAPSLSEPPPALPQPRTVAVSAESAEDLPPLPIDTGDSAPTAVMRRSPIVLPDPIPAYTLGDIQVRRPETLREIEELARRQSNEAREIGGAGMQGATPPRRDDTTADLPRAPAPTEARPIKPIEIPEEFIPLEQRRFAPQRMFWAAPALCHTPLYFQDLVLERYGQNVEQAIGPAGRFFSYPLDDPRQSIQRQQLLQPAYSAGMFFLQLAAWPYNLVMDPPWEAHYDLGYYRPGDPIPPDTTYLPTTGLGPPLRGRKY